jgi:hypothetical protein
LPDQPCLYLNRLIASLSPLLPLRSFVPIAPGRQLFSIPSYVARARLGTPAQALLVAIEPSNDAVWVSCAACAGCARAPSFDPTRSSTYCPESAFIPFVSFGDLDNNTFKGLTSLLSVEQEIQYDEHT